MPITYYPTFKNSSGNVGIATISPATKLDIYGPVSVRGTTVLTTNFDLNAGNATDIYANIRVLRGASLNDGMYIGYGGAGGNLKFFSNSGTTEFMTIATTGNVGVGNTNPSYKLDVNGAINSATYVYAGVFYDSNNTAYYLDPSNTGTSLNTAGAVVAGTYVYSTTYLQAGNNNIYPNGLANTLILNVGNSAGNNWITGLSIAQGGNVGVGTTSPLNKLSVISSNTFSYYNKTDPIATFQGVSPATVLISVDGNTDGYYAELKLGNAHSTYYSYSAYIRGIQGAGIDNYRMEFGTANGSVAATRMTIATNGNVGIGTTSPGYKLDVNGTFRTATNNLTIFNDYLYVSPTENNTFNSAYSTNGIADMWINYAGYNNGNTQFRNFNVGNGKNGIIAWFDGTNKRMSINNSQAASYPLHVVGTAYSDTDFRAPIFYDSGDTNYYLDPASFSLISSMGIGGLTSSNNVQMYDSYVDASSSYLQSPPLIIRKDNSATGAIDQAPVGLFIYNLNGTNNTWTKLSMGSREAAGAGNTVSIAGLAAQKTAGTANGWATGNLHFWTKAGNTQITNMIAYSSGYVESGYSFRAPIFYDSNDTTYYTDPSSLSNVVELKTNKNWYDSSASAWGGGINMGGNNPSIGFQSTASTWWYMLHHSSSAINFYRRSTSGSWNQDGIWDSSGNLIWQGSSVRAPIFYDQNNTAYYLDPASTTNLNNLIVAGTMTFGTLAYTTESRRSKNSSNVDIETVTGLVSPSGPTFLEIRGFCPPTMYRTTGDRPAPYGIGFGNGAESGGIMPIGAGDNLQEIMLYGANSGPTTFTFKRQIWEGNTQDPSYSNYYGSAVFSINTGTGVVTASTDIRSPIFYDSNNTAYYIDAASGSSLNTLTMAGTITGALDATASFIGGVCTAASYNYVLGGANDTGNKLVIFVNGSTRTADGGVNALTIRNDGGAFVLGQASYLTSILGSSVTINSNVALHAGNYNSYAPTLTGTGASGSWGISVTGSSASCTGNAATVTNGVYTGTTNTYTGQNYFQSNLGTTSGAINSPPLQAYATGTNAAFMSFHRAGNYAVNMGLDSDNVLRIGGWSAAANRLQLDMSGNLTLAGVVDATQFRDASNTAYYLDPNSLSNIRHTIFDIGSNVVGATGVGVLFDGNYTSGQYRHRFRKYDDGNGLPLYVDYAHATANSFTAIARFGGGGTYNSFSVYGTADASGDFRAPIFYDSNNTTYYLDPASTSVLYDLTLIGSKSTYLTINPGNGYEAMVRYIGGAGSGWYVGKRITNQLVTTSDFHFYSEAAGATVGGIDTSGNVFSTGSVRSPIFYDSNNTSFYIDPASTSNFNVINTAALQFNSSTNWNSASVNSTGNKTIGYNLWQGGKKLNADEDFTNGNNGITLYNNSGGTALSITRTALSSAPNSSGYVLRVSYSTATSNGTSPGFGGFYFATGTRANAVFVTRFIANVPSGRSIAFQSNAFGTNSTSYWLTNNVGTGKWEEYAYLVVCGDSGTFSSTNYFNISGGADANFTWDIASATVFDITNKYEMVSRALTADLAVSSPVYYDKDNTAYYIDAASTSVLNALTIAGNSTFSANSYLTFGPNSSWSRYLRIGGDGYTATAVTMASVVTTNGNLHLDAAKAAGMAIYLNWYGGAGGTIFGNGSGTQVGAVDSSGNTSFSGTLSAVGAITQNGNQVLNVSNYVSYSAFSGSVTSTYGNFTTPGLIMGDAQYGFYVVSGNVYYKSASGGVHYWRNIANNANTMSLDNSGTLTLAADVRAPIFYDSNNTAYYLNPAGNSQVVSIYANDWFRAQGDTGLYFQDKGYGITSAGAAGNSYGNASTYGTGLNGWQGWGIGSRHCMMSTGGDNFGVHDNTRSWLYYWNGTYHNFQYGYLESASSVRAPLFYDSNNTAYYLDPASTSSLNILNLADYVDVGTYIYLRNNLRMLNSGANGWLETIVRNSGNPYFQNSIDGGTFLASDGAENNNWLFQENARGWGLFYFNRGTQSGQTFGNYTTVGAETFIIGQGTGTTMTSTWTGYNASSKVAIMLSNYTGYIWANDTIFSATGLRAPIFYDSNDTAYYTDPNGTSVLNRLKIDGGNYAFDYFQSLSDFTSGTLVTTDIPATAANGLSFVMNVVGKSYNTTTSPFNFSVQGYLYSSTIINYSGLSLDSTGLTTIKIFENGGFLCFWWARVSYWNAFEVSVRSYDTAKTNYNRVTNITDVVEPTGTKKVTVTLQSFLRADVSATNAVDLRAPRFYDSENVSYYVDAASTSVFNAFTGSHSGGSVNVTSVNGAYLGVNNTTNTNGYGISLYNGASAGEPTYGLMFQGTGTFGTHGSVTGDWATYFTMNNDNTRGWVFRKVGVGNVASISAGGVITATTFSGALSGNATTATTLATARTFTIGSTGKTFNGSADVSWSTTEIVGYTPAYGTAAYQSKSLDTITTPGLYQYDGAFGGTKPPDNSPNYRTIEIGSAARFSQIAMPWNSDGYYFRRYDGTSFSTWRTVLHDGNYNSYALPLAGGTLTGTLNGTIGSFSTKILSSRFHDSGDSFLFRSGSGAGTTRHLNLADATGDPSGITAGTGITWGERSDNNPYYLIYPRYYANGSGTYSRLAIAWHTGIEIGAAPQFGGTRFFNNSPFLGAEIFSVGNGDSNVRVANNIYAQAFYDLNNATYYVDPASTSNLNAITAAGNITAAQYYTGGWFRNSGSGNGLYNESTGEHFYSDASDMWNIASANGTQGLRFRTGGYNGTIRGYVYANDSNDVGLLNNAGNWRMRVVGGDYALFDGSSVRAVALLDSNDTSYYVDPNSASNLVSITNRENLPGGAGTGYNWNGTAMSYYWTKIANVGGGDAHAALLITYKTDVNYNPFGLALLSISRFNSSTFSVKLEKLNGDGRQILVRVDNNNDVWLYTEVEWSSYKTWKTISKLGSPTVYYSSLTEQLTTPANSIEIASGQEVRGTQGAATSATVSTVANHIFGGLTVRSDVRAPRFYDSDNITYYLDPASTSNLVGLTVANTITGSISGTAGGETLGTTSGRGNNTSTQLIVSTAAGQAMYVGRQIGGSYSFGSAGIFTALSDNTNGGANIFFQGYIGSSSNTPGGTLTYSIRADGQIYTTMNSATGIANNSFNVAKTILGALHIANGSGTTANNNQAAITFQGDSNTQAQAGIYVSNNSTTGTAMAFATTDNYGTGPQIFMSATNAGIVNFSRARPTYAGNVILDAANYSSYAIARAGDTVDGITLFRSNKGATSTVGSSNTYALQTYSSDAGAAGMSFHRGGYYAVNIGLDPDNVFRIGGWSASANRLQLDMSGNLTLAGVVDATQFRDSSNTAYYLDPASTGVSLLVAGKVGIGTTNPTYKLQIGTVGSLDDSIRIGTYAVAKNTRQYIGNTRDDSGLFEQAGNGDSATTVLGGVAGIRIVNTTGTLASAQADNSVQLLTHIYNGGSRVALHANYDGKVGVDTASPSYKLHVVGTAYSDTDFRAPIFYDSNDTNYYLDPAGTSNLNKFSTLTMSYNGMNAMSASSPYVNRYNGSTLYRNGTMGYGTTDCNVIFSNWGSGFIDSWGSPANAPGGSTHYVGLQGFHYNHQDNSQAYGFQMLCAGEANNRFFWRSAWPTLRSWVEMIHTGNYNSYSPTLTGTGASGSWGISVTGSSASCTGNSATATTATSSGCVNSDTGNVGGNRLQYWQISGNTTLNPDTEWYNAIRMGHGDPVTYYSNTLAVKMTGSNLGDIYTRTTTNGTAGTWNRFWNNNNDGAGSGLDADLLDGYGSATANTINTIVLRDGSGNFSAGTIDAAQFRDSANTSYYVDPASTSNLVGLTVTNTITGNISGTAGSISGFNNPVTSATANTIVYRDGSGHITGNQIFGNYHNSSDDTSSSGITFIMAKFGDNYHRSASAAKVATFISGQTMNIAGNAASVTDGVYLSTNQSISGVKTFSSAPIATNIAKAWVHFNGTSAVGTACTVNASYNVTSVSHNATGDYTVSFVTGTMTDANYAVAGTTTIDYTSAQSLNQLVLAVPRQTNAQSAGSCRLVCEYIHGAQLYDAVAVRAVFFR